MAVKVSIPDKWSPSRLAEFLAFVRDPLSALVNAQQRYGDITRLPVPGTRLIQFTLPEQVNILLKLPYRDRLGTRSLKDLLGSGLITNEGDDLIWRRRLAIQPLTRKAIVAYVDDMVRLTRDWCRSVNPERRSEVTTKLFALSLDILIHTLFGSRIELDEQAFAAHLDAYMHEFYLDNTGWRRALPASIETPGRRNRREAIAGIRQIVIDSIDHRRRAGPGNDLLYVLMNVQDDDGHSFSDTELLDELLTMLIPGHETPALMLGYALWLLACYPNVQRRLYEEATARSSVTRDESIASQPYAAAVVDECFRLYPPAYVIGREARRHLEIGGVQIRVGDQLVAPQWVVHRDPRWWHYPEAFRPERWLNGETDGLAPGTYFPFGGGQRSCIGAHFSRLMGQIVLSEVVKHLEIFPVPDYQLSLAPGPTLRPRDGIQVRLERRSARKSSSTLPKSTTPAGKQHGH